MEYAFLSHESAIQANWAIARNPRIPQLDDEGIWMIPSPDSCVTTQGSLKKLMAEVSFDNLGIIRRPIDLLVPDASSRSRGKIVSFHVWRDMFPDRAFRRIHERIFVSSPLFTILQLTLVPRPSRLAKAAAEETAREDARIREELGIAGDSLEGDDLLAWEAISRQARAIQVLTDFAGTYRLPIRDSDQVLYEMPPLMHCDDLRSFLDNQPSMRGSGKGYAVADLAFDNSGSPMETALALMLTLPVEMGGYGLPKPILNWSVPIDPEMRGIAAQDEIIADLCWRDYGLVIEYDSWEKHGKLGPAKLAKDHARANSLTALGWKVLTVGSVQIASAQGVALIARQVATLLGITLAEPTDIQRIWRSRLHAMLMPRIVRFS